MHPTIGAFDVLFPDEPLALDLTRLYTQLQALPD
jgi:hypothetical protein